MAGRDPTVGVCWLQRRLPGGERTAKAPDRGAHLGSCRKRGLREQAELASAVRMMNELHLNASLPEMNKKLSLGGGGGSSGWLG